MRALVFLSIPTLLFAWLSACADSTTMCQSGPKYGTQCYNSSQQTTYSSPPSTNAPPPSTVTPMSTTPQR